MHIEDVVGGRTAALLDGERVTVDTVADVRFVPDAFRALVPERSPVLAAHHEEVV